MRPPFFFCETGTHIPLPRPFTAYVNKEDIPNIPYVFIALFATKLGQAARLAPGFDFSSKVLNIMQGFSMAFENIMPSFHPVDLLVGIAAAVFLKLAVYIKGKNAKKFRKNLEYGSARWGTREDIAPFIDPVFENNVILTQTESLILYYIHGLFSFAESTIFL